MDEYVDWACCLLPEACNGIIDVKSSVAALQEMSVRFGIHSFVMLSEYDATRESIPLFLLHSKNAYDKLKNQLDPSLRTRLLATALLSPNLYETEGLDRFLVTKLDLLPICFPLSTYQEWMDLELNHLLYKKKYNLLFTSFELAVILFPDAVVKKLLRISGAVFQFNYKAFTDPRVCKVIETLLEQKSRVLLGSSLSSLNKIYFYELDHYLVMAKKYFSPPAYSQLLSNNRLFQEL